MQASLRDADGRGRGAARAPLALHGHSSIAVTWDNYGHLFPGDDVADAALQETFLAGKLVVVVVVVVVVAAALPAGEQSPTGA